MAGICISHTHTHTHTPVLFDTERPIQVAARLMNSHSFTKFSTSEVPARISFFSCSSLLSPLLSWSQYDWCFCGRQDGRVIQSGRYWQRFNPGYKCTCRYNSSPTLASSTTKTSTEQPALMDLSSHYCLSENSSPLSVASPHHSYSCSPILFISIMPRNISKSKTEQKRRG